MLIHIGYRNFVRLERIVTIVSPNTQPIKYMISDARENGKLVDATMGKRTRSVIVTDSNHIILSANLPDTIVNQIRTLADRISHFEAKPSE